MPTCISGSSRLLRRREPFGKANRAASGFAKGYGVSYRGAGSSCPILKYVHLPEFKPPIEPFRVRMPQLAPPIAAKERIPARFSPARCHGALPRRATNSKKSLQSTVFCGKLVFVFCMTQSVPPPLSRWVESLARSLRASSGHVLIDTPAIRKCRKSLRLNRSEILIDTKSVAIHPEPNRNSQKLKTHLTP